MTNSSPVLRELEEIARVVGEIPSATLEDLDRLRTELLGRKSGRLTRVLRSLSELPPPERRAAGERANALKVRAQAALAEREGALRDGAARGPAVDPTMPGRPVWRGAVHPVTAVVDEICDIFRQIGFSRVTGPEAETEDYNFTKLNISLDHPSADMQDTFYLGPKTVLRTHTSPMQARTMERFAPPIRIVVPGQAYRRDAFDPSHAPVFEQVEGLVVDEGVTFVDFKAGIDFFVRKFFAPDTVVRFRPSYFPFTEPSAEVDVQCQICTGAGCATCKGSGWIEIMGAGMVHPAVFEACGVDAERYTGYAFGMGPHRIALLRYGAPDIRLFFDGDVRFLAQFVDSR